MEVRSSCGDEWCTTIRSTGKLTNVKIDKLGTARCVCSGFGLGPGLAKPKQRTQVRHALDEGEIVRAKVTVRAKDAAGNVATAKRTIRLVKHV